MTARVFIDGEAGTTGLQIRQRLEGRSDIQLVSIDPEKRKDAAERARMLNSADLVILCLPDDAAREAVSLIGNLDVKVIDASSAHRVADGWSFGFPEFRPGQREEIVGAAQVSNPGCYSTGAIAILAPLIRDRLLPADWPVSVNAVSGYTGGGKAMIAQFEDAGGPDYVETPFRLYGLSLKHKHVPEMTEYSGLTHAPVFSPAVGRYAQGMLVNVPLALWALPGRPSAADTHGALTRAYEGERFVEVASLEEAAGLATLEPQALNGTNRMRLFVFAGEGQAIVTAQLDNLGKGASGAAVQNMNLMLGLPEDAGL